MGAGSLRHSGEYTPNPGALLAVVSDSYDIFNAVSNIWGGQLRQEVIDSGATVVIRPDSGYPVAVVSECARLLDQTFGHSVNGKGFKILNHVRIIQGDGISPETIPLILGALEADGFATDNIAFGMGGGLLQKVDRNTQKFAFKCSATRRGNQRQDTFKDPVTDPGKASIRGRVRLLRETGCGTLTMQQIPPDREHTEDQPIPAGHEDAMRTVWENGDLTVDDSLEQIRARLGKGGAQ